MKITYKPVVNNKLESLFIVKVAHEHGDADNSTHETIMLRGFTTNEFIEYMTKFNEISDKITTYRSAGVFPTDFEDACEIFINGERRIIPLERDNQCHSGFGYYAAMNYEELFYYDQNGVQFTVSIDT